MLFVFRFTFNPVSVHVFWPTFSALYFRSGVFLMKKQPTVYTVYRGVCFFIRNTPEPKYRTENWAKKRVIHFILFFYDSHFENLLFVIIQDTGYFLSDFFLGLFFVIR